METHAGARTEISRSISERDGMSMYMILLDHEEGPSKGTSGHHIGPFLILAVASVGWSVLATMVIGRRVFRHNWFEHSLAEFGESQGNVATGFVMVDMVDPLRKTDVVTGYSYRQLITRPILGGGFLTALSIPVIASLGLLAFTVVSVTVTLALTLWGILRSRRLGCGGGPA